MNRIQHVGFTQLKNLWLWLLFSIIIVTSLWPAQVLAQNVVISDIFSRSPKASVNAKKSLVNALNKRGLRLLSFGQYLRRAKRYRIPSSRVLDKNSIKTLSKDMSLDGVIIGEIRNAGNKQYLEIQLIDYNGKTATRQTYPIRRSSLPRRTANKAAKLFSNLLYKIAIAHAYSRQSETRSRKKPRRAPTATPRPVRKRPIQQPRVATMPTTPYNGNGQYYQPRSGVQPSAPQTAPMTPQTQNPQNQNPQNQNPQNQIPQNQIPQNQIPQNQIPQNQIPQNQIPQNQIPQNQWPQTQNPQPQIAQAPTQTTTTKPFYPVPRRTDRKMTGSVPDLSLAAGISGNLRSGLKPIHRSGMIPGIWASGRMFLGTFTNITFLKDIGIGGYFNKLLGLEYGPKESGETWPTQQTQWQAELVYRLAFNHLPVAPTFLIRAGLGTTLCKIETVSPLGVSAKYRYPYGMLDIHISIFPSLLRFYLSGGYMYLMQAELASFDTASDENKVVDWSGSGFAIKSGVDLEIFSGLSIRLGYELNRFMLHKGREDRSDMYQTITLQVGWGLH